MTQNRDRRIDQRISEEVDYIIFNIERDIFIVISIYIEACDQISKLPCFTVSQKFNSEDLSKIDGTVKYSQRGRLFFYIVTLPSVEATFFFLSK